MRRSHPVPVLSLLAALAGCSQAPVPTSPTCTLVEAGFGPAGATSVSAETVITGLEVPWGIAFLPGGDWLITERPGRVRLFSGGALEAQPVATIAIQAESEGGLLGIAVSPSFATDRFFYVYGTFS